MMVKIYRASALVCASTKRNRFLPAMWVQFSVSAPNAEMAQVEVINIMEGSFPARKYSGLEVQYITAYDVPAE